MRFLFSVIFVLAFQIAIESQEVGSTGTMISQLESLSRSPSVEKNFAQLYLETTLAIETYNRSLDSKDRMLMNRMIVGFADYFFKAVKASKETGQIPSGWKIYFTSDKLSPIQLKLIGANSHINGDIWQTLTTCFTLAEIKQIKPHYQAYNKILSSIYLSLYKEAISKCRKLKSLHTISLGLEKRYGKKMLGRWRKRQFKIAVFYFNNPGKFLRLKKRVKSKMKRIDRMIINKLC